MQTTRQLRYELQVKKDRVLQVQYSAVSHELRLFFQFLSSRPILKSILDELTQSKPAFEEWYRKMQEARSIIWPVTEIERAKVCLVFLEKCRDEGEQWQIAMGVGIHSKHLADLSTSFLEQFFLPFYEYIDGRVEEQSTILHILQRFKARCEWFNRGDLLQDYADGAAKSKGEHVLDQRLRKYLFDQGIDYPFSQPASPSGKADVIAGLESSDPLVLEIKLFDNDQYDKAYVRKGFRQALKYANDYRQPVGYLVIYNVSASELRFSTSIAKYPPRVEVDGKTIFIITIDLGERPSASRDTATPISVTQDYLIQQSG